MSLPPPPLKNANNGDKESVPVIVYSPPSSSPPPPFPAPPAVYDPATFDHKSALKETMARSNDDGLTAFQKFVAVSKQDPLVPIGVALTVSAFSLGVRSWYRGNQIDAQKYMRYRVASQFFTIGAVALAFGRQYIISGSSK